MLVHPKYVTKKRISNITEFIYVSLWA